MSRGIIPFILALAGLSIISFAAINQLFEWQISEVVTDPPTYEVSMSASSWVAWFGDSLHDKPYVFRELRVSENGETCSVNDLSIVVNRSRKDELLERLSLTRLLNIQSKQWVMGWILIEIALSAIYNLWFIIWHERRAFYAIIFLVLGIVSYCFVLAPAVRVLAPYIGFHNGSAPCQGTITFNAQLLKVSYWVPILFLAGIFAEIAALAMMIREIMVTISKRKESSTPTVG